MADIKATQPLVWLPLRDITLFLVARQRNKNFPFKDNPPTNTQQIAWRNAFDTADDFVVTGLPWSQLAFDATVWKLYKKTCKET